ncbi:Ig-like domain-containing protein [Derxia gummosa]|uniref:Ig-like domain-containing protein n=1 Tax=Derxia gummosa DSM 723 TaxID=1121388 RepID=A0A8B6X4M2_9BURK|nr:Ig-like domain-containing protein [Derxia gummosa]
MHRPLRPLLVRRNTPGIQPLEPRLMFDAAAAADAAARSAAADAALADAARASESAAVAASAGLARDASGTTAAGATESLAATQQMTQATDPAAASGTPAATTAGAAPTADDSNHAATPRDTNYGLVRETAGSHEVVFIDGGLQDPGKLAAAVRAGVDVVVLDPTRDGLAQIGDYLAGHHGIEAIHVVSHGDAGSITLGSTLLTGATLDQHAAELAGWQASLAPGADLLLYGCDVAADAAGLAFIDRLGALTGTDVAASTDTTGTASAGGDWQLEASDGHIDAAAMDLSTAGWDGRLTAPTLYLNHGYQLYFTGSTSGFAASSTNPDIDPAGSNAAVNGSYFSTSSIAFTASAASTDANGNFQLQGNDVTGSITFTGSFRDNAGVLHSNVTVTLAGAISKHIKGRDGDQSDSDALYFWTAGNGTAAYNGIGFLLIVPGNEGYFANTETRVSMPADNRFVDGMNVVLAAQRAASASISLGADTGSVYQGATLAPATGVLANDTATLALTVTDVSAGTGSPLGNVGQSIAGSYGHLTLNSNGTYSYVADNAGSLAAGTSVNDVFTYAVSDGQGGTGHTTLTITVRGQGPAAVADTGAATEDGSTTGNVKGNDSHSSGDTLTVTGVTAGAAGSAPSGSVGTSVAGSYGHLTLNADGSYSYAADNANALAAGAQRTDTFTYAITDTSSRTAYTTLTITVTGANDGPSASADTGAANEGQTVDVAAGSGVLVNDSDPDTGDSLVVSGVVAGTGTPVAGNVGNAVAGSYGSLTLASGGGYRYVADNAEALPAGATRQDVFTYEVSDGHGGTATATLTVTITGTNDAPVAGDDSGALNAGANLSHNAATGALANDSDADTGDTLAITGVAAGTPGTAPSGSLGASVAGSYGHLTLNADGSWSYDADNATALAAGAQATDVFTYTVSDGHGGSDTATISFTVTGTNDAPTAANDSASASAGGSASGSGTGVLGNDSDPDTGDSLAVSGVVAGSGTPVAGNVGTTVSGSYGDLVLGSNGSWSYSASNAARLAAGSSANDVFTYEVSDGHGGTATATLTIAVSGANDAPAAVNDSDSIGAGGTASAAAGAGVLVNDSDADLGDSFGVTGVTAGSSATAPVGSVGSSIAGSYGHLTLAADGSYSYVADSAVALAAGATATDVFTYTITDGQGATATATLSITITGTNDAPSAANDSSAVLGGGSAASTGSGVLANDSDPDTGDSLAVSGVVAGGGTPLAGNVGSAVTGSYGDLTLGANGHWSYSANNAASLAPGATANEVFTYEISDGHGGAATATLTIVVTGAPVNSAPSATDDSRSVNEDATVTGAAGAVLANDSDADVGDTLVVSGVAAGSGATPSASSVGASVAGSYGHLTLNADGSYSYNADNAGSLSAGVTRTDSFTYEVSDGHGGTDTATITFTVTGMNDAPTAANDSAGVGAGGSASSTGTGVLANDSDGDSGDSLVVAGVVAGTGTPVAGNVGSAIAGTYGELTLGANGAWSYVASNAARLGAGASGSDVFTYSVSDGHGGTASATLTITVTGANDGPTAANDSRSVNEDATVTGGAGAVLANDSDPDTGDSLVVSGVAAGASGTPSAGSVGASVAGSYGHLTLNADGSYSYAADGAGSLSVGVTRTDSFTYEISDGHGGTDTATITFTVTGTNDAPTATNDSGAVGAGGSANSTGAGVLANDGDGDSGDSLVVAGVVAGNGSPVAGNVGSAITGSYGELTLGANGTWSYVASNAVGLPAGSTASDVFTYAVSDGHGGTATATLTITITGANDDPSAANDSRSVNEDATVTAGAGAVLANDSDPDAGDSLVVSGVAAGASGTPSAGSVGASIAGSYGHLTLNADGSYSYAADGAGSLSAGVTRTDSFTYEISDGHGGTDTATITFTATGTNDAPSAANDSGAVNAGDSASSTGAGVLANDSDGDSGDSLAVSGVVAGGGSPLAGNVGSAITGSYGELTLGANGAWSYVASNAVALAAGSTASDVFTYAVSDGHGGTATATLTITVTGINDAPSAANDSRSVDEDATVTGGAGAVLANDSDPDVGDSLVVSGVAAGAGGTPAAGLVGASVVGSYGHLTLNADGSYSYAADGAGSLSTGVTRTDSFTYEISDGHGGTATATISFTVTGTNDAPTAANDSASLDAGDSASSTGAGVLANDGDADSGDSLAVSGVVAGAGSPLAGNLGASVAGSYGHLTLNADGSYSYAADNAASLAAGSTATDVFTYEASDGHGGTATATLTITVTGTAVTPPANQAPVADNDHASVGQTGDLAASAATGLLANDSDPDAGDSLVITGVAVAGGTPNADQLGRPIATSLGVFTLNTDGSYAYEASAPWLGAGETATDVFTYTVADGHGGSSTATVSITVTGRNDAPVAADDRLSVTAGQTLVIDAADGVLVNDGDADAHDQLVVSGVALARLAGGGTLTGHLGDLVLAADGSLSYTASHAADLRAGETADDVFTYAISDGHGGSATARLTITVTGTADAPVFSTGAGADAGSVTEDDSITTLEVRGTLAVTDADHGQSGIDTSAPVVAADGTVGHLVIDADGHWTYSVANAAIAWLDAGQQKTETFTVRSADGTAHDIVITITGVADAPPPVTDPVITGEHAGDVTEDRDVSAGNLAAGGTLAIEGGADGTRFATTVTPADGVLGSLAIDAAGRWSYHVANDAVQSLGAGETRTETFTVATSDGKASQVITVTIHGVDDPSAPEGTTVHLTEGDDLAAMTASGRLPISDVDGLAAFVPQAGTAGALGTFTLAADGRWTFTPNAAHDELRAGEVRTERFTVRATDGSTAVVTIEITGSNDAPVAPDASATGLQDGGAIAIDLPASDIDGSIAGRAITALPAHGRLYADAGLTRELHADDIVAGARAWFVPEAGWNGNASFGFAAVDNDGARSVPATATVEVLRAPSIGLPAAFDLGASDHDRVTSANVITLAGDAVPGQTLRLYAPDGHLLAEVRADADGHWSVSGIDMTALAGDAGGTPGAVGAYSFALRPLGAGGDEGAAVPITVQRELPPAPLPAPTPAPVPAPTPVEPPAPPAPARAAPAPVFDSALTPPSTPLGSFMHPQPIDAPHSPTTPQFDLGREQGDIYTRPSGFQVMVNPSSEPNLSVFRGVDDQVVKLGQQLNLQLPADTFLHTQINETVTLQATLANGKPLPGWLSFDGKAGTFTGEPPANLTSDVAIKVVARDSQGREAVVMFRITVGKPTGQRGAGLSQQLQRGDALTLTADGWRAQQRPAGPARRA